MRLTHHIIVGLSGAEEGDTLERVSTYLASYQEIDKEKLIEKFTHLHSTLHETIRKTFHKAVHLS